MDPELGSEDRELLEAACEAAEAAAAVHRSHASRSGAVAWEEKGASDYVTVADREAEGVIVETLLGRFPEHDVLAEEEATGSAFSGSADALRPATEDTDTGGPADGTPDGTARSQGDTSAIRWIVDPLDGTTNWLHGYPEYAVSIAALDPAGLRLGVILNSVTGELFTAVRDRGSRCNGEPIRVSSVPELRLSLVGTGFPFKKLELLPGYLEVFGRVLRTTSGVRRAGAAALDLCNVAAGRFDAFWELWLMPWDIAAGILIIREAGGVVERLPASGTEPDDPAREAQPGETEGGEALWPGGIIAANPALFPAFRELVYAPP